MIALHNADMIFIQVYTGKNNFFDNECKYLEQVKMSKILYHIKDLLMYLSVYN